MAASEMEMREERTDELPGTEVTTTRLGVSPFSRWSYQDAVKALATLRSSDYDVRHRFAVKGEHWHAEEWVGPGNALTNEKIEEQFAPDDAVGEALWNIANAFKEPQLGFAPLEPIEADQNIPEEISSKMKEAASYVSGWWDRVHLHSAIQNRLYTSGWSGFAAMRPWVPQRFMLKAGDVVSFADPGSIGDAFEFIFLATPSPSAGGIYIHPNTQDKVGIYFASEQRGDVEEKFVELVYLDPDRLIDADAETVLRVVYENPAIKGYQTTITLGGRLLMSQMRTRAILTDSVLRSQRQLNLLTSLITRMAETAAFRGRYTMNAKPHGTRRLWEEGDVLRDGEFLERDEEDRQWVVTPVERTLGAATTTELVGLDKLNQEGAPIGQEMPGVLLEEPVDPTAYINAGESVRRRLMRMCSQGHLSGTSNFEVSGIAYEQARAVFEKDLNARRIQEEGMLRDLITSVLALAEYIAGEPGYFTQFLRVTIDQHVDAGPRSPDSVRLDLESYAANIISKETTQSRLQVEDLEAENVRIKASPNHILALLEKAVPTMTSFDEEALRELLKLFNLPDTLINALNQKQPEPVAGTAAAPGAGGKPPAAPTPVGNEAQ